MTEPFVKKDQSFLLVDSWQKNFSNVTAGISTRLGGISEFPFETLNLGLHVNDEEESVIKNRMILSNRVNIRYENWVCAEQVHGANVKKIDKKDKGKGFYSFDDVIKDVDGYYTFHKGIFLTAGFADCVPLFFYSPEDHCIGIAHAGWKGTVGNIVQTMVNAWTEKEGISVTNIHAVIGPAICKQCYQVDDHVISQVNAVLTGLKTEEAPYENVGNGQYLLNLRELNKQLMIHAGISSKNIEMSTYCTSCNNDLFFSHRKEGGKTGRMMGFITLD